jgi:hypothetical protein
VRVSLRRGARFGHSNAVIFRETQAFSGIAVKRLLDESLGLARPGFSHVF